MSSFIWKPFTIHGVSPDPIKVLSGSGLHLNLADGRTIKDLISSWWVNVHGHAHPIVAKAIYDQALTLEHVIFADYTHDPAEQLSTRLVNLTDGHFGKVFFSDNGSTSVEVALKLAKQYWLNRGIAGRNRLIAFEGAYHGDTFGAMSAGDRNVFNAAFNEWMFDVDHIEYPHTWIGDQEIDLKESRILKNVQTILEKKPDTYAAVLIEPLIQGAGGMRMCSPGFLQKLAALTKKYHVLLIFDEVMTGFGRTGSMFAFQKAHVSPDIICLSKGLTGGFLPMAVTMTTDEVFEPFKSSDAMKTFWHGHSYTANPLGCAAALASLDVFDSGASDYEQLSIWQSESTNQFMALKNIERVRQCGTILAFDVKINNQSTGYLNSVGQVIKRKALDNGMLLRPLGNVVYLMPPYCITKPELDTSYIAILEIINDL